MDVRQCLKTLSVQFHLAFSHSSKCMFTSHCFWTSVNSLDRLHCNEEHIQISVQSTGKHKWFKWCLWVYGLFGMIYIDEFLHFLNIFCHFAATWLPCMFVNFNWYLTSLEMWIPLETTLQLKKISQKALQSISMVFIADLPTFIENLMQIYCSNFSIHRTWNRTQTWKTIHVK